MCNNLSPSDYNKANEFLVTIRSLLQTGDVTIKPTEKNKAFEKKYNIRHNEKIKILESLTADDCTKIEFNNNPLYPKVEVYFFLKDIEVFFLWRAHKHLPIYKNVHTSIFNL